MEQIVGQLLDEVLDVFSWVIIDPRMRVVEVSDITSILIEDIVNNCLNTNYDTFDKLASEETCRIVLTKNGRHWMFLNTLDALVKWDATERANVNSEQLYKVARIW